MQFIESTTYWMYRLWSLALLIGLYGECQLQAQFPDSVVSVNFGPGYNLGFGPDNPHFPMCILGAPDRNARPCSPALEPEQLLSLGAGGQITLFFRRPIIDGPGPDFTIFENAFYLGCDTTRVFAETGLVEVSEDGVNFLRFPFQVDSNLSVQNPLRYRGLAGVTPTNGDASFLLPGSPNAGRSGGDSFDLSIVGLSRIHYIRIIDSEGVVNDGGFLNNSFDLDAVVALNQAPLSVSQDIRDMLRLERTFHLGQNFPNPFNPSTMIPFHLSQASSVRLSIMDLNGRELLRLLDEWRGAGSYMHHFTDGSTLSSGIYIIALWVNGVLESRKMTLLK